MEIIILVVGGLILGAFALRLIAGALKLLYEVSPFIVIWAVILFLMYALETNYDPQNTKDTNATIARTAED